MLATKLRAAFFLLAFIFANEFAASVNSLPTRKPTLNTTTTVRPVVAPRKSTARGGRFLGKFSILAGLGLPEPTPLPLSRNDLLYEQRAPAHLAASYNFPPTRWGPYVAAVYEPVPLASFAQNPLGYLAHALNPFNWFVGPESGPASTPAAPPDRHRDDIVVVVRQPENELLADEQRTTAAFDGEDEREREDGTMGEKSTEAVKMTTPKSIRKMKLRPSIDIEKIMDLIAEETTMQLVRVDDSTEDESRQAHRPSTTTKKSSVTTRHTVTPTVKTTPMKHTSTKPTTTEHTTMTSTTVEEVTDESIDATSKANTSAQNSTGSTAAPHPHPSYGPPHYVNGYYYGGYAQNVSHIQLTTQTPVVFNSFNNDFRSQQQPPNNYYETFDPQSHPALDYYSHFDQLQPVDNHFPKSERAFANNHHGFGQNGFRPSYPVYQ